MEVITVTERIDVVELSRLTEIPSEFQVHQAMGKLQKQREEFPDKYNYIKFPFGMMDFDGLSTLHKYHEYMQLKKKVAEEKAWLVQSKESCESLRIKTDQIIQYFQSHVWCVDTYSPVTSIRNLVGKRWLSDDVIDTVFDIINTQHDDTLCFVCKPTHIMYSSIGLHEKMCTIQENGINVSKIIVALNVGCDHDGIYYVSDEKRQGVHWALLAIDLIDHKTYYGDSLGWSLPSNLESVVGSNLKSIERDLRINIMTLLKNIVVLNDLSFGDSSACSDSCKLFYPLQSCSNVCGVVVACMGAVLSEHWSSWLTWSHQIEVPLLSNPSVNSRPLRLIVMSWIVNNSVNTHYLVPEKLIRHTCTANSMKMDTSCSSHGELSDANNKQDSVMAYEGKPSLDTCSNAKITIEQTEENDAIDSDDDFMPPRKLIKMHSHAETNGSASEDELIKSDKVARPLILGMLPEGYTYKMLSVTHFKDLQSFTCEFKVKLENEECARKWIAEYNEKTKETMVYECCRSLSGKRIVKKLYLRCQHKQRQTGKHTKSNKTLKTTHKLHNCKNTDCPAQIIVTLFPPKKRDGFCIDITLKHTHNHLTDVADSLRFRPVSESTKQKYYDLFKQGHSPASAHLEYETHLTYMDDPKLLADRNVNPKVSDVYNLFNKWRKYNLGVRTGKNCLQSLNVE